MKRYIEQERAKWWPVSSELMAQYCDGSHTDITDFNALVWLDQNGKQHRDGDRPAYIGANSGLYWYQNDLSHRDGDRPSSIGVDGSLVWSQNGQTHRICGPAVIYDDKFLWVIYDEDITLEVSEWLAGEEWQGTPEQIERFQRRFT